MRAIAQQDPARHADELRALDEASEALARAADFGDLVRLVPEALLRLVPCDVAALGIATEPAPRVLLRERRPLADGVPQQAQRIVRAALQKLTGARAGAAETHYEACAEAAPSGRASGDITAICTVPLIAGERALGLVCVLSLQRQAFDERTVLLVRTLGNQAASAIARLWARPLADRWPLEPLLEGVPGPLLLLSPEGEILARNSAAEAMLPLLSDDGDASGPIRRLVSPTLEGALAELFSGGDEVTAELRLDDQCRPYVLLLRCTRLSDNAGQEIALAHLQDVTHERLLHEQMLRSAKLASIGELAAGVAHELNNPLTTVLGFADLLLRADLPAETIEDVQKIYAAALRSRKIAHDVLCFVRGSTTGMTTFDLNDALGLPIRLLRKHFQAADVQVAEVFDPALPPVHGDMGQWQQVLLNLLHNAHQAMVSSGVGSCVTVRTGAGEGTVILEVRDDGPGVPEALQERMFEPFFTTKPPGEGTGLGLSIIRRIVERHGGRISVRSREGEGTCFTIEAPLQCPGQPLASEAVPALFGRASRSVAASHHVLSSATTAGEPGSRAQCVF